MIFPPESIKKKLEYFENDPALRGAFAADAEVLNCEENDYLQGPAREEFEQARAGLPPAKLPSPVDDCNIEVLRKYLRKELYQYNLNNGRKRRNFLYGVVRCWGWEVWCWHRDVRDLSWKRIRNPRPLIHLHYQEQSSQCPVRGPPHSQKYCLLSIHPPRPHSPPTTQLTLRPHSLQEKGHPSTGRDLVGLISKSF